MTILKTYQKPEEAFIDAGYLGSMGIEAVVDQDPAFGGILLGVLEAPYRLLVPEDQKSRAEAFLAQRPGEPVPSVTPPPTLKDSSRLNYFFRFILAFDLLFLTVSPLYQLFLIPTPPMEVDKYLTSFALSNGLWMVAYDAYWPMIIFTMLADVLCFFYISIGRSLFTISFVWFHLAILGPPPSIPDLYFTFLGTIQNSLCSIALALMYWSPLKEKFR